MKAISLKQPWATLVGLREKGIETRKHRWQAAVGAYLAIHASKTFGPFERRIAGTEPFASALGRYGISVRSFTHTDIPTGTVVAVAHCVAVRATDDPTLMAVLDTGSRDEVAFGDYSAGRWAYVLSKVWTCGDQFIHVRGQLGIWELPADVEQKVLVSLQHHDDLPAALTSPELRQTAQDIADAHERTHERVRHLLQPGGAAAPDRRSPIDRLIDQAVKRG